MRNRLFLSLLVMLLVLAACGTGETGGTGETIDTNINTDPVAEAVATTNAVDALADANANDAMADANANDNMADANANDNMADANANDNMADANANMADANANVNAESGAAVASGDSTLAAIKERGRLVVGVKYDVPLFGFLNPATNKVEGFDVDMAKLVAEQIFGDPEAVEFKEAVSKNRIPYLEEGVVDVVFSTMTANAERAEQIDFSTCYYVAGQSLLVPTDSAIDGVATLGDKTIGTVKGSTSEKNIRTEAPDATVELYDTYSEAVQAMQSGRVDAVTTDDIILYGFQKNSPDRFKVVGGQFTQEPYAAGIKKGNTELLAEVDAALMKAKESGKWAELYKQWISDDEVDVPPDSWQDVGK